MIPWEQEQANKLNSAHSAQGVPPPNCRHTRHKRSSQKKEATKSFCKSVAVTHEMRHLLVRKCNEESIACMVAPYEADSQLAYLSHSLVIDVVVTEDSDSLAYGCPRILFKMDHQGNCDMIEHCDLGANEGLR